MRGLRPVVTAAMILFVALEWNGIPGQARDTVAYHPAAEAARVGSSIYDPLPTPGPHEFDGEWLYLYPPPLAAMLSALPAVDYRTFDRVWLIMMLVAFWVLSACLARVASGDWSIRGTGTWAVALFLLPGTLVESISVTSS